MTLNDAQPFSAIDKDIHLVSESGFAIGATTAPTSAILSDFYEAYDLAFTLANEKEDLAGFAECLALNHGAAYDRLAARFGPFCEYVAVIQAPQTGEPIGGVNFVAFPLSDLQNPQAPFLSVNLNYIFINAQARNRGYFRGIVADFPGIVRDLFAAMHPAFSAQALAKHTERAPRVYTFIEQNDPVRMSAQDYAHDTETSGLDQVARIGIWGGLGAKIVDFPYVQPPLSAGQEADRTLVYSVLGVEENTLDAGILKAHLERFFGISVLKGREPESEAVAAEQLSALEALHQRGQAIPLLEVGPAAALETALRTSPNALNLTLRDRLRPSA